MQNSTHNNLDDKFAMNFNNFDTDTLFNPAHMVGINLGLKRTAHDAGLDHREGTGLSSDDEDEDDDDVNIKKEGNINRRSLNHHHQSSSSTTRGNVIQHHQTNIEDHQHHHHQNHNQHHHQKQNVLPNGKKTKGRVKIKMEFIDNKLRRYTTFSKRKTGIMKKAYELSTLTGTQVMLLVASETGHVYTFATRKLQPMITSEAGKQLIQTCLNSPDPPQSGGAPHQHDQRMSATGYEETELTYAVTEEEHKSPSVGSEEYMNGSSYSGSDCSSPPTPSASPTHDAYFHQSASTSSSVVASDSIINSNSGNSSSNNNNNNEKKVKNSYNNGSSGSLCSSSSVINSVGGSETQSGSHIGIAQPPFPLQLPPGLIFTSSVTGDSCESPLQVNSSCSSSVYASTTSLKEPVASTSSITNTSGSGTATSSSGSTSTATSSKSGRVIQLVPVFTTSAPSKAFVTSNSSSNVPALTIRQSSSLPGGSVVVGSQGGSLMYSPTGSVVYSPNPSSLHEGGSNPLLLNLPQGLHLPTEGDSQGGGRQLVGLSMKLASAAVLQQTAAAAAVVSAATSSSGCGSGINSLPSSTYSSNSSSFNIPNETLPTDLSLHIKREDN